MHDSMAMIRLKQPWQKTSGRQIETATFSQTEKPADRRMPFIVACYSVDRSEDELMSLPFCWKMCCNCPGYRARLCSPSSTSSSTRTLSQDVSPLFFLQLSLYRITLRNLGISIPRKSKNIFVLCHVSSV